MRIWLTILLALIVGCLYAQQPDTSFRATTVITQYAPSPVSGADWRITFQANDLRGEANLADLSVGAIMFDNNCMPLRLQQITVAGAGPSATIQGEFSDFTGLGSFPAFGPGAIVELGPNGLIGTVQEAPERINTCITWYNTFSDLGGGRVALVDAISDTLTVFQPPRSGDVIIRSDTSFIGHHTGEKWIITYLNTAMGSGGPVDWNDLINVPPGFADGIDNGLTEVSHDPTMTGTGTPGDLLRTDTSLIATQSYVNANDDIGIDTYVLFENDSVAVRHVDGVEVGRDTIRVSIPETPSPTAAEVSSDNSSWQTITGANVQANLNSLDTLILNARTTGVKPNFTVSINAIDSTLFDLSAVQGEINGSLGYAKVNYPGATGIPVANIAAQSTWIYIDENGSVQQQTSEPTPDDRRNEAYLARLASNGSKLIAFEYYFTALNQGDNTSKDIVEILKDNGIPLYNGFAVTPNANLTFARSSGNLLEIGVNNDPQNPNLRPLPLVNPANLFILTRSTTIASNVNDVNVTQYDLNGTLTTITNNRFVAHRLYLFASGNHVLQLGQDDYGSLSEAISSAPSEAFTENPAVNNGDFLGWWVVKKNTTNLQTATDAVFVRRTLGGTSSGGNVVGALLAANNLSDVDDAGLSRSNLNAANAAALGVASSAVNMGTYTGSTIPDNVSQVVVNQSLETSLETKLSEVATDATILGVGTIADPLRTDTNLIATQNWVLDNQVGGGGEQDSSAWRAADGSKTDLITTEIYRTGGIGVGATPASGYILNANGDVQILGNLRLVGAASNSQSIGNQAGNSSQTTAIGHQANRDQGNTFGVFIGRFTGQQGSGSFSTALGVDAGQFCGSESTFVGYQAGRNYTLNKGTFVGASSGASATGSSATYVGYLAGASSTGNNSTAVGANSMSNAGLSNSVAAGSNSGLYGSGVYGTIIGAFSGQAVSADNVTAVGGSTMQTVGKIEGATAMGYIAGGAANGTDLSFYGHASSMEIVDLQDFDFVASDYNATTRQLSNADNLIAQLGLSPGQFANVILPGTNAYGTLNTIECIDASTVEFVMRLVSQSFPATFQVGTYEERNNATAIGSGALIRLSNQVALGDEEVNMVTWGDKINFRVDDPIPAQDGHAFVYNADTDQMELKQVAANGAENYTELATNVIQFDGLYQYGNTVSPRSGNISFSFTDALVGKTQIVVHNDTTAPTFPAEARVSGTYQINTDNIFEIKYISSTLVLINIL